MTTPAKLNEYTTENFKTLLKAATHNDLALVSAIRKSDGANVALVCAVTDEGGNFIFTPFAEMIEGNPFELYEDPTQAAVCGAVMSAEMQALVARLRALANDPELMPEDPYSGICSHVKRWLYPEKIPGDVFKNAWVSWEHYSEDPAFPVPDPTGKSTPVDVYYLHEDNLWVGEYGALRRDLCRHLADYLEKHL